MPEGLILQHVLGSLQKRPLTFQIAVVGAVMLTLSRRRKPNSTQPPTLDCVGPCGFPHQLPILTTHQTPEWAGSPIIGNLCSTRTTSTHIGRAESRGSLSSLVCSVLLVRLTVSSASRHLSSWTSAPGDPLRCNEERRPSVSFAIQLPRGTVS